MGVFLEGFIFILVIGFTHLLWMSVQAISGSHYFYGVYINQIEIDKDTRKKVDKVFKKKLNINLIINIAIYILLNLIPSTNFGINIGITTTVYIATYLVILKSIYNEVKNIKYKYIDEHGISTSTNTKKQLLKEDEELSKAKEKIKKKFKILFEICIGISVLSFLYVLINHKNMPDVIITHWGAGGKPDGYSEKNIINVFFTNVIDILMVVMFAIIGIGTVSTPVYIDTQNVEVNRKKAKRMYENDLIKPCIIFTVVTSVCYFIWGNTRNVYISLITLFILGAVSSCYLTLMTTILQRETPSEYIGRVFASYKIELISSAIIGIVISPYILDLLGTFGSFSVFCVIPIVLGVITLRKKQYNIIINKQT